MEKGLNFQRLVKKTCRRIVWQFFLCLIFLYFIPIMSTSVEIVNHNQDGFITYSSQILMNVFSWVYICVALIIITSFNIIKMLDLIKKEMNIVYNKSMWIQPQPESSQLKIEEFMETNRHIDQMQKRIKESIEKEKTDKEDLILKVSAASHDLKTLLTIIKGNSDLLSYTVLNEVQKNYLKDTEIAVDKLSNYLKLLIDYSKTYYDINSEWDIYSLLDVTEMIKEEISFIGKNVNSFIIVDNIQKDETVYINLNFLNRAISNILHNAIEYGNQENKKIEVNLDYQNQKLIFSVWNSNSFFSKNALENAGKLFYRESKSRNGEKSHFGIGLAFVKRIAELHSGTMELLNINEGAKVILTLSVSELPVEN